MTYCMIRLTQDKWAFVDEEDFERIGAYRWCAHKTNGKYRAMRRSEGPTKDSYIIYMHRDVLRMNRDDKRLVDHINGDPLDNRKANLRFATKASNGWNRTRTKLNKSGFKGVSWDASRGKYVAVITANKKRHHIGYFDSPIDAAQAHALKAYQIHGSFMRIA